MTGNMGHIPTNTNMSLWSGAEALLLHENALPFREGTVGKGHYGLNS